MNTSVTPHIISRKAKALIAALASLCLLSSPGAKAGLTTVPPEQVAVVLQLANAYFVAETGHIIVALNSGAGGMISIPPGAPGYANALAQLQARLGFRLVGQSLMGGGAISSGAAGTSGTASTITFGGAAGGSAGSAGSAGAAGTAGTAGGGILGATVPAAVSGTVIVVGVAVIAAEVGYITYVYTYEIPALEEEYIDMSMQMGLTEAQAQAELETYNESVEAAQGGFWSQYGYWFNQTYNPWAD